MVVNQTGITDLSSFDSTLPSHAVQELNKSENYQEPSQNITFIECLLDRGVISNKKHKKVALMLEVNGDLDNNPHRLIDYSVPVSTASYTYDPVNEVCYVGMVSVQDGLRERGVGTQMKKYLNNHMSQEKGEIKSYTWISTDEGKKLADKTGFAPDKEIFSDVDNIWSREL